jgi:NAD(P)H-dependent FMN reductase
MAPVSCTLYQSVASLPHFNPDDDREPLPNAVGELRKLLWASDGIMFSTPEYAGTLPGSFKNLLDWSIGGGIHGAKVGWINPSATGGSRGTYDTLRVVLGYANAVIVEAACANIPITRSDIDAHGMVMNPTARDALERTLRAFIAEISTEGGGSRRKATGA